MAPRFSVFIATSLDGYIAREGGDIDWLQIVHPLDASHGYDEFFASCDALVVGRGTYDTVLGFAEYPYAGKRVFVLTHRPAEPRHGETFVAGTAHDVVARVGDAQRVYVDGGNVIRQFFAANLITDATISIVPIVLGSGIRLFERGEGEHRLQLQDHRAWPSGLVQLRYTVNP
ncbi:MAG TPA: dihydrofolate reductase family protein [Kofleriaceae bacterium]|nr:dihydrofolate reductase family protein [Kofleriaceae bacterium]